MGSRHHAVVAVLLALLLVSPGIPLHAAESGGGAVWISRAAARPLSQPFDVAVDRRGIVFLLESGSRTISIFSPQGEFLREIPGRGAWKDPSAIAVGPTGSIFLADGNSGKVLEMDLNGKVRREYAAGGNARLTGVGVLGEAVFCVDNRNHRILVFRKPGGSPESWGKRGEGAGEFQSPFRLAVDPSGRVFVTDVMNSRVQWFSAFGQHLGTIRRFGAAEGKIFRPTGIAMDPRGRVWVSDSYTGLVQLFEENGNFSRVLKEKGRPVVFRDPIALVAAAGGVWVADQRENRLGLFRN